MAAKGSSLSLNGMPTEVIRNIGPFLHDYELKDLTLVSKRFRVIFVARFLHKVKFSGTAPQIAFKLREIFSFPRIWGCIKHVDFHLLQHEKVNGRDELPSYHSGFGILGDFLRKTTELKHITFYTGCRTPQDQFVNLIGNTHRWPRIRSMTLENSTSMTVNALTHGCYHNHLESLRLPLVEYMERYKILKSRFPGLKRLVITGQYIMGTYGDGVPIVPYGEDVSTGLLIVPKVLADFRQLEWLVLDDAIPTASEIGPYRLTYLSMDYDWDDLNDVIEEIIHGLQLTPFLVRLSFALRLSEMSPELMRLDWDSPGPLEPLTEDETYKWYSAIILRISSAVPRLEQISITHCFPHFYRGIKSPGEEMIVTKEDFYAGEDDFEYPGHLFHEKEQENQRKRLNPSPTPSSSSLHSE